jgi:hypothetical protein
MSLIDWGSKKSNDHWTIPPDGSVTTIAPMNTFEFAGVRVFRPSEKLHATSAMGIVAGPRLTLESGGSTDDNWIVPERKSSVVYEPLTAVKGMPAY